jgi:hypothetical protein
MKLLASIGALAILTVWAAVATAYPIVISGTAGIMFLISVVIIWELK